MSLEQQVAALVTSTDQLTQAVVGKVAAIDAAVEDAKASLESQLASRTFTLRNRVINGDMRIDQRRSGSPLTDQTNSTRAFAVDRFRTNGKVLPSGRFTLRQDTDAPSGFIYSLRVSITTAEVVAAGQIFTLEHPIELQSIADFSWGPPGGQPATLTFWVKSTVPGKYSVAIRFSASAPEVGFLTSYTIEKAYTWEKKSVSIVAPPNVGSVIDPSAPGALICWNLGSGSNSVGVGGAWSSSQLYRVRGDVNLVENLGASLLITGVQLEKGDVATPFEFRPLGLELHLCQRYYFQSEGFDSGSSPYPGANAICIVANSCRTLTPTPPVTMRAAPTVVIKSAGSRLHNCISDAATGSLVEVFAASAGRHRPPQLVLSASTTAGRLFEFDYSLNAEL